ncbi:LysR family transcriptional regulator [Pseudohalocynthiibacter aestuariivivens]|uniref:LysR family transcriptional regulator n=1 Tax=Roseovarius pelagicus TaxID=2980108 RepID=A0ABY6D961_9RHOB|nr:MULTISPECIES: LysR family transcriptional regulator [Rhodobacterales]QIE45665.1 LysR family transcriptional regulator [Pseudohalocynthiibacter aestuariivivens]UXX82419.1 LysR family transcriptional regulator [Roseovarius pelagicus]
MNSRLSLRQLRYFASAAKHGSFKRAAEVMNVSASSISLSVGQLEGVIGCQLFERRHARGLVLTDAGKETLIEARNVLSGVEGIEQSGGRRDGGLEGALEVGVLRSLAPYVIPAFLEAFRARYPGIDVYISEGVISDLLSGLVSGRSDLALTYDTDLPAAIRTWPVLDLPPRILVAQGHPLAGLSRASLRDFEDYPYILADYANTRDYIFSIFADCGLGLPRIAQRVQSFELLRNLVGRSDAYALVNMCPPYGNDPDAPVRTIEILEEVRTPVLSLAGLRRVRPNPAQEAFIALAQEMIGSEMLLR